jgi:Family of unknown function (DUF5691)
MSGGMAGSMTGAVSGAWTALLPAALVGTERYAQPLPAWPGEIGSVIAQASASAEQPAVGLLRAAAVLAACSQAGLLGHEAKPALPEAARASARPALADRALLARLPWVLQDGPPRLVPLLCLALDRAGLTLPPLVLPAALDAGRRSIALRAPLLPVLGERGLWLAAQRDDWQWAAGTSAGTNANDSDESRWSEGTLEQRREFLRRERARDPTAARERLVAALPELPAKERAELIAALVQGLGLDDEALLDAQRTDRSGEVRRAALDLLLRLPDAAHPQRAAERVSRLLAQERGLLRKRWTIEAPAAAEADWKDDNVEATRPKHETLGERAWWLYQLVRQVPLGWWTQHTAMAPADLRGWADGTDWTDALLRGWRDVLLAAPEEAWCTAFLDAWPKAWPEADRGALLAQLPLAQRERYWSGDRQRGVGVDTLAALLPQIFAACPVGETLSAPFSATLAATLREAVENGALQQDWALRSLLPDAACILHPSALPALRDLPRAADETAGLADAMRTLAQTVELRLALGTLSSSSHATPP